MRGDPIGAAVRAAIRTLPPPAVGAPIGLAIGTTVANAVGATVGEVGEGLL